MTLIPLGLCEVTMAVATGGDLVDFALTIGFSDYEAMIGCQAVVRRI
jgi:hypothetical protein